MFQCLEKTKQDENTFYTPISASSATLINPYDYYVFVSKVKVMPGDSIVILPQCACV